MLPFEYTLEEFLLLPKKQRFLSGITVNYRGDLEILDDLLTLFKRESCPSNLCLNFSSCKPKVSNGQRASFIASLIEYGSENLTLNLSHNDFDDREVERFACAIPKGPQYLQLNLTNNLIGLRGAKALATTMAKAPRGFSLNLSYNHWNKEDGDEIASAFTVAMKKGPENAELNLRKNKMGDEGACAFFQLLRETNYQFKYLQLDISGIGFGEKAAKAFLEMSVSPETKINLDFKKLSESLTLEIIRRYHYQRSIICGIEFSIENEWGKNIGLLPDLCGEYTDSLSTDLNFLFLITKKQAVLHDIFQKVTLKEVRSEIRDFFNYSKETLLEDPDVFLKAAKKNRWKILNLLMIKYPLDRYAYNTSDKDGFTVLQYAVRDQKGNPPIEELIGAGADPFFPPLAPGRPDPLWYAIDMNARAAVAIVKALPKSKFEFSQPDTNLLEMEKYLRRSILEGRIETVRLFLVRMLSANAGRFEGRWTPFLQLACQISNEDVAYKMCEVLIEHGAKSELSSLRGSTPLMIALDQYRLPLAILLFSVSGEGELHHYQALLEVIKRKNIEFIEFFIEKGVKTYFWNKPIGKEILQGLSSFDEDLLKLIYPALLKDISTAGRVLESIGQLSGSYLSDDLKNFLRFQPPTELLVRTLLDAHINDIIFLTDFSCQQDSQHSCNLHSHTHDSNSESKIINFLVFFCLARKPSADTDYLAKTISLNDKVIHHVYSNRQDSLLLNYFILQCIQNALVNPLRELLILLFDSDILPIQIDDHGLIYHAALHGQTEIVKLFIELGFFLKKTTFHPDEIVQLSARENHAELEEAFLIAAKNFKWETVIFLLRYVDIKSSDSNGYTVLHYAAMQEGSPVDYLLKFGANPLWQKGSHASAFEIALSYNNTPVLVHMLKNLPDIFKRTRINYLYEAVKHENVVVTELLLSKGADPDWYTNKQADPSSDPGNTSRGTPLHLACGITHANGLTIAELLVKYGANVDILFKKKHALQLAVERDNTKLAKFIFLHEVKYPNNSHDLAALQAACKKENHDLINFFLASGINTYIPSDETKILLFKEVKNFSQEIREKLFPYLFLEIIKCSIKSKDWKDFLQFIELLPEEKIILQAFTKLTRKEGEALLDFLQGLETGAKHYNYPYAFFELHERSVLSLESLLLEFFYPGLEKAVAFLLTDSPSPILAFAILEGHSIINVINHLVYRYGETEKCSGYPHLSLRSRENIILLRAYVNMINSPRPLSPKEEAYLDLASDMIYRSLSGYTQETGTHFSLLAIQQENTNITRQVATNEDKKKLLSRFSQNCSLLFSPILPIATLDLTVFVLGNKQSGKSNLILRYAQNIFSEEKPSLNYQNQRLNLKREGRNIHLTIREIPLDQFFSLQNLPATLCGFMLAIDPLDEKSLTDIKNFIASFTPKIAIPVILVGTKNDRDSPNILSENIQHYAARQNFPCIFSSAKTGAGVNNAFEWLIHAYFSVQRIQANRKQIVQLLDQERKKFENSTGFFTNSTDCKRKASALQALIVILEILSPLDNIQLEIRKFMKNMPELTTGFNNPITKILNEFLEKEIDLNIHCELMIESNLDEGASSPFYFSKS